jgi:hypothetical protein
MDEIIANTKKAGRLKTVPLDWNEVYYTNCPLVSVEIGKDFMLSDGYINNDFDVKAWAAPGILEQAGRELLEAEWKKQTTSKLPAAAGTLESGGRIG